MIRNRPSYTIVAALLLGLTWIILTGELRNPAEYAFGIVLGFLALQVLPRPAESAQKRTPIPLNPIRLLVFGYWFIYYIVAANVVMVRAVLATLTSFEHLQPAIIAYDTELTRAIEISLLANWITLTPGTLTMHITPDGKTLFIHTVSLGESRESFCEEIRVLERHVQRLFS